MIDFTWKVIEKDLQGLAARVTASSRNIANANTPKYAKRIVSFEDQLRDVIDSGKKLKMKLTNDMHIPTLPNAVADVQPVEIRVPDEIYRLDGNNVDPEREMAILSEARMLYSAMSRFAAKKLNGLRTVITGR
ncbi:MAG: flagellar basal body rod protein FlgB [Synergistaceae bacterium]|nr:flagellar basal body rod protein FlgB [Synergistaceae bacterium]